LKKIERLLDFNLFETLTNYFNIKYYNAEHQRI